MTVERTKRARLIYGHGQPLKEPLNRFLSGLKIFSPSLLKFFAGKHSYAAFISTTESIYYFLYLIVYLYRCSDLGIACLSIYLSIYVYSWWERETDLSPRKAKKWINRSISLCLRSFYTAEHSSSWCDNLDIVYLSMYLSVYLYIFY